MKATIRERVTAILEVAPLAAIGFCIGLILQVIGGLIAPFGAVMWLGFVMAVVSSLYLHHNGSAIRQRIAQKVTARLGY